MTIGTPNKSERIRRLAKAGATVSEIARATEVSYQFAYNVCQKTGLLNPKVERSAAAAKPSPQKPALTVGHLLDGGFTLCGLWTLREEALNLPPVPRVPGVYAFALDGAAQYVGVATRSLSTRLNGYARPGPTQRTNQRLKEVLMGLLAKGDLVEVWCATPPDLEWNGFRVSGPAGLEAGLLTTFSLPWNVRGL